ncbi:hypothetical protein JL100_031510 (plasmid) [Skermanella mucosa]|uniref:hypothetical protein n=1 Tax=Skermanella mucosa TaxID=1789672 RepID=UPI00192AD771|nr:hypothetical protein [Skermanella mucosa]UEM24183.1 hypothetical protein JL100_031510 [Skermanella mucosa]
MSAFDLPVALENRSGMVHPVALEAMRVKALGIYCWDPEDGRCPQAGRLSMDLFGDEIHAGSAYTEREIMIIGEECERTLEWLVGDRGLCEAGTERGRSNTLWCHLKWMRRERDRLIASRISNSLADTANGGKAFEVGFGFLLNHAYWSDDYEWLLQRIRNLLDLVNTGRYYMDFGTLTIWFENEVDAAAFRKRVAALRT